MVASGPVRRPRSFSLPLIVLVGLFLLLAALYSVAVPLFQAPDEPEHFAYVRFLAVHHTLPTTLPSVQITGNQEANQPPLYYLLALPFTLGASFHGADRIRPGPQATWPHDRYGVEIAARLRDEAWPYHGIFLTAHRVRLLSVLLGGVTVILTYEIALTYAADRRVALGAAAFTAFLPGFLFASATIDNDALVNPLAAALLFLTLRHASCTTARHRYLAIATGITGCLALFTKLDAIVPIAVATFIFFLRTPHGQRLAILASTVFPLIPAAVFWLWRIEGNHQHNLIGQGVTWPPPLPGSTSPLDWHEPFTFFQDLWTSFVGTFGWQNVWLPPLWYLPFALVISTGLASWLLVLRCPDRGGHRQQSLILLAWSLAVLAAVLGRPFLVRGSLAGYDHGRFLYPALPAIATMVATGWQRLLTRWTLLQRFYRPVLALDILSAFLIPWLVIRPAYPPPYPVQDHLPPGVHRLTNAQFRASVALAAITLPSCPIGPGLGTFVTFYWRVQQPLPAGTWLFVHVVNSHGVKAAAFDGPPLYDTFPVTSWRQGDVIIDREILTIAKTAPPGDYTVKLGWYNPKTGVRIPLISGATEALVGHLRVGSPPLHGRQCWRQSGYAPLPALA